MMKRILLAVTAALLLSSLSGTAWAHPAYKDSDPKAGSTVSAPPTELWVEFTESIEDGYVHVFDPCGERVDHGEPERNLTNDRITVGTHGDKAGAYRVEWEVLGSDSHVTRGEFSFSSSDGDGCPVEDENDPEPKPEEPSNDDDDRSETDTTRTTDDPLSPEERSDAAESERREGTERSDSRRRQDEPADERDADTDAVAQDQTIDAEETAAKGIWDGIPMGDFIIALVVAALIGAAGGRLYAGILGPRR